MKRSPMPKRKTRLRAKKRSKAEFHRIYGSEERVKFVASLPCVCCGKEPTPSRPSHNHHVRTDGVGRKGPYHAIVPMCEECHDRFHQIGKLSLLQQSSLRVREKGYYNKSLVFTPCDTWEEAAEKIDDLCDLAGVVVVP